MSDIEIPRQKNIVFLFMKHGGVVSFHTYHTSDEIKQKFIPNRPTMVYVEGADEGGAGKVDQWFETVDDGKHEITFLAVKFNVAGRIAVGPPGWQPPKQPT